MKLNAAHRVVVYIVHVNLLGEKTSNAQKNVQALVVAVKVDDLETNDEKTQQGKTQLIWHTGIRKLPGCRILQIIGHSYADLTSYRCFLSAVTLALILALSMSVTILGLPCSHMVP